MNTEQQQIIDTIEFLEQKIKGQEQDLSELKQRLDQIKQNENRTTTNN